MPAQESTIAPVRSDDAPKKKPEEEAESKGKAKDTSKVNGEKEGEGEELVSFISLRPYLDLIYILSSQKRIFNYETSSKC